MTVFIECNRLRKARAVVKRYGDRLVDEGYNKKAKKRKFRIEIEDTEFKRLLRFCNFHRITATTAFSGRSSNYRQKAFDSWTPLRDGRYRCVYCGRKLDKDHVEVDHLYPVGAVKRNFRLQKRLKTAGRGSVNDVDNLVPACSGCNRRKGMKMGKWIIKGKLGRHPVYWKVRLVLIIITIFLIANLVLQFSQQSGRGYTAVLHIAQLVKTTIMQIIKQITTILQYR